MLIEHLDQVTLELGLARFCDALERFEVGHDNVERVIASQSAQNDRFKRFPSFHFSKSTKLFYWICVGVENPLDLFFLRFLKKTDLGKLFLAIFCPR